MSKDWKLNEATSVPSIDRFTAEPWLWRAQTKLDGLRCAIEFSLTGFAKYAHTKGGQKVPAQLPEEGPAGAVVDGELLGTTGDLAGALSALAKRDFRTWHPFDVAWQSDGVQERCFDDRMSWLASYGGRYEGVRALTHLDVAKGWEHVVARGLEGIVIRGADGGYSSPSFKVKQSREIICWASSGKLLLSISPLGGEGWTAVGSCPESYAGLVLVRCEGVHESLRLRAPQVLRTVETATFPTLEQAERMYARQRQAEGTGDA